MTLETERGPIVSVRNLSVRFQAPEGSFLAVDDLSYDLFAGEVLAIIGESGSGKSTGAETLLGLQRETPGSVVSGSVVVRGRDITKVSDAELKRIRGREVSIIFQDPGAALDPALSIGYQFAEFLKAKEGLGRRQARERTIEILHAVGLAEADRLLNDLPSQLSGGMRQRAMIGLAIALSPAVLVADEPTTALDVTVQAGILRLIKRLTAERRMGVLFISHDLAVARDLAHRIGVMYGGRLVEIGATEDLISRPSHPYTRALLESTPVLEGPRLNFLPIRGSPPDPLHRPNGCAFHPRCEFAMPQCLTVVPMLEEVAGGHFKACHLPDPVLPPRHTATASTAAAAPAPHAEPLVVAEGLRKEFSTTVAGRQMTIVAVEDASFEIYPQETLAVVGESGSGKSTVSRMVAGLLKPTKGIVTWNGKDIWSLEDAEKGAMRRNIQMVFQDPWSSLNPRMSVGDIVAEPWKVNDRAMHRRERKRRAAALLEDVGLRAKDAARSVRELSGGQRQRVAIARALALRPALVICDEPLSALDVSVQAQILNLLRDLQVEHRIAYLFVSHDLAVVRQLADRVVVMNQGRIVESGSVEDVYLNPSGDYMRNLLASIPGRAA